MSVSKIKILYIIGNLDRGGAETHLFNILPLLKKSGVVNPLLYLTNHYGSLAQKLVEKGVSIEAPFFSETILSKYGFLKPIIYFLSMLKLAFVIVKFKPKMAHVYLPGPYILSMPILIFLRVPIKILSRRISYSEQDKKSIFFKIERFFHKYTQAFTGCSTAIVEDLKKELWAVPANIRLIFNGIICNTEENVINNPNDLYRKYAIDRNKKIIVITANFYKRKGYDIFLQALYALKIANRSDWQVLCIGRDGGELYNLKRFSGELGLDKDIIWIVNCDCVRELLSIASIAVLSSYYEGMSNALLEYMCASLAIVATKISGNVDAIVNGQSGILVEPGDFMGLSKAMEYYITHPDMAQKYGQEACLRVNKQFSLNECVSSYLDFYKDLIDKG